MIIFPAIDIKGGKCVRLFKGDFNKVTKYKKSPIVKATEFSDLGFKNLHIIESCFKGLARSLRQALEIDKRIKNKIPSTKGTL